jgi:hypothetical protein
VCPLLQDERVSGHCLHDGALFLPINTDSLLWTVSYFTHAVTKESSDFWKFQKETAPSVGQQLWNTAPPEAGF